MFFKSREYQVHEHVRQEIEARMAGSGAPGAIRRFLLERWSYLLVGIYTSHGDQHPDWEAGWHTVNALLWSLAPKHGQAETEQLLRLLPTLLGRLQDGCEAMHLNGSERDELLSGLTLLHAAVLREGMRTIGDGTRPGAGLGADGEQAFSEAELATLGAVTASPGIPSAAEAPGGAIADLNVGDSLRLRVDGRDKKLILQWVSPSGGMYLFADKEGYDAVSLTRVRLADKLAKGEAALGK